MDETPRRRRSWLLIVSLSLNVMLVAAIVTVGWRIAHRDTRPGAGGVLAPRTLMARFPDAAPRLSAIVDAHTAKIERLRRASFAARQAALAELASPTATRESLSRAMTTVAQADAAWESEAVAMMGEGLAALTPAERQALAAKLKARERSWWFRTFVRAR